MNVNSPTNTPRECLDADCTVVMYPLAAPGGHPDIASTVFGNNLRGCVRDVVINTFIVDLDNPQTLVSSFDVTPCI